MRALRAVRAVRAWPLCPPPRWAPCSSQPARNGGGVQRGMRLRSQLQRHAWCGGGSNTAVVARSGLRRAAFAPVPGRALAALLRPFRSRGMATDAGVLALLRRRMLNVGAGARGHHSRAAVASAAAATGLAAALLLLLAPAGGKRAGLGPGLGAPATALATLAFAHEEVGEEHSHPHLHPHTRAHARGAHPLMPQAPSSSSSSSPPPPPSASSSSSESRRRHLSAAVDVEDDGLVDITTLQPWNHNWDDRHHVTRRGRKTRYIVLIRHGHYHSDEREDSKRTLTKLGHQQAELMAQRLAHYHWVPTQISCSTQTRARQTTDHIQSCAKFINIDNYVIDSKLREGRPHQPIPPARVGIYHKSQVQRDGSRIDAAFESIFYRPGPEQMHNTYDVVVCHANVIRYFVCRALQIPKEAWIRMAIPHCSITILAIRPTGYVSLKCLGESGFMPIEMVTTN